MSVDTATVPRVSRRGAARPDFARVAEETLDDVVRYLAHLTGNRDLAEDLTSATFERALRDWRRYDPRRAPARVWLLAIARGVALDHFRSEGRRAAREERYAAGEERSVPPPEPPAGHGELRRALATLTRAERELIALRVVLELDGVEAARIVGISPSAASSGLHRALSKLRMEVSER